MKKSVFTLLAILLTIGLFAGGKEFEGEISFSIKLEGENAQMLQAFMPTGYVYKIKDDNMLFIMEGGMMASMLGEILVKGKDQKTYIINHTAKKVFYINPEDFEEEKNKAPAPKITDMKETETILGYECKKYKVVSETEEGTATQYMWVTDELRADITNSKSAKLTGNLFVDGIDGFPLKIKMEINQAGISLDMLIVVNEIEEMKMNGEDFKIPSEYSMEEFDAEKFGQGMGF